MDLPGIKDFYDGLNHEVAREIEQAAHEMDPPVEGSHDLMNHEHSGDPFDDVLGATDSDTHHHDDHGEHPDHGGLLDTLVPAALHGAASAVVKFAVEQLTEAALSETLLGSSESHAAPSSRPVARRRDGWGRLFAPDHRLHVRGRFAADDSASVSFERSPNGRAALGGSARVRRHGPWLAH